MDTIFMPPVGNGNHFNVVKENRLFCLNPFVDLYKHCYPGKINHGTLSFLRRWNDVLMNSL